jgi:DNA-binding transcriptional LysR family regulator
MDVDAVDLHVFEAVARAGGITRAAEQLNMVQSNVTRRIRLLEQELGVPLFYRHSRGVALTGAGSNLLPYATRIGLLFSEARQAVQDGAVPRGRLAIGSLETTAAVRLPPILAAFHRSYPEVDLALQTGTEASLIADVLEYRVDGAFVAGPVDHPDLIEEPIVAEHLVVVTTPSCPGLDALAASGDVKVLVFRAGCSYRQRLEEILAQRGVVDVRRLEFGTVEGIVGCVAAGLGITLLPETVVTTTRWNEADAIHPLPEEESRVQIVFIRRRDGFVSSALRRFLECAQEVYAAPQEPS